VRSLTSRLFSPCSRHPKATLSQHSARIRGCTSWKTNAPTGPVRARGRSSIGWCRCWVAQAQRFKRINGLISKNLNCRRAPRNFAGVDLEIENVLDNEFAVAALPKRLLTALTDRCIRSPSGRFAHKQRKPDRISRRSVQITISPTKISSVRRKTWARLNRFSSPR